MKATAATNGKAWTLRWNGKGNPSDCKNQEWAQVTPLYSDKWHTYVQDGDRGVYPVMHSDLKLVAFI